MKTQKGRGVGVGMLGFHPYFDIRHNKKGRAVSCTRQSHFTHREIPWYWFSGSVDRRVTECGRKDQVI